MYWDGPVDITNKKTTNNGIIILLKLKTADHINNEQL